MVNNPKYQIRILQDCTLSCVARISCHLLLHLSSWICASLVETEKRNRNREFEIICDLYNFFLHISHNSRHSILPTYKSLNHSLYTYDYLIVSFVSILYYLFIYIFYNIFKYKILTIFFCFIISDTFSTQETCWLTNNSPKSWNGYF